MISYSLNRLLGTSLRASARGSEVERRRSVPQTISERSSVRCSGKSSRRVRSRRRRCGRCYIGTYISYTILLFLLYAFKLCSNNDVNSTPRWTQSPRIMLVSRSLSAVILLSGRLRFISRWIVREMTPYVFQRTIISLRHTVPSNPCSACAYRAHTWYGWFWIFITNPPWLVVLHTCHDNSDVTSVQESRWDETFFFNSYIEYFLLLYSFVNPIDFEQSVGDIFCGMKRWFTSTRNIFV